MPPPAEKSDSVMVGIAEILREFMGLEQDQVVFYNQQWRIPTDDRLYLVISFLATRPYGNAKFFTEQPADEAKSRPAQLVENSVVHTQDSYTINAFSASNQALLRSWEITAALNCSAGQQVMERLGFAMSSVPTSVNDLSSLEAAARLYRIATTITVLRSRTRQSVIESFNNFQTPESPALIINP